MPYYVADFFESRKFYKAQVKKKVSKFFFVDLKE